MLVLPSVRGGAYRTGAAYRNADRRGSIGREAERRLAFADAYRMLNTRIGIFASLPVSALDKLTLQRHLDQIGAAQPNLRRAPA